MWLKLPGFWEEPLDLSGSLGGVVKATWLLGGVAIAIRVSGRCGKSYLGFWEESQELLFQGLCTVKKRFASFPSPASYLGLCEIWLELPRHLYEVWLQLLYLIICEVYVVRPPGRL